MLKAGRRESASLTLRAARADDGGLLFAWTNAQRACGLALSGSEALERSAHDAWFAARLEDPDCRIWIVEHVDAPVGVVRLEWEADRTTETVAVSVYIAREGRRLGLASAAIERTLQDAAHERGALTAVARVRSENTASRRLFEGFGFSAANRHADHVVFRRRVAA